MSAYAATFERVEKKYCLSREQHRALLACLRTYMQPDEYPQTVVSSLYFDTPTYEIISRSLDKPLYKEKLRVRSYGTLQADGTLVSADDRVFVELKKKHKGVVYKRRLGLSSDAARAYLGGMEISRACALFPLAERGEAASSLSFKERQVAREIDAFRNRYPELRPCMITRCLRTAWKQPESQLRITFDTQLQAGRPEGDAFLFQPAHPVLNLMQAGQVLMEVKQAGGLPLWLTRALAANHVYPQSFSKYGTAYEKECLHA